MHDRWLLLHASVRKAHRPARRRMTPCHGHGAARCTLVRRRRAERDAEAAEDEALLVDSLLREHAQVRQWTAACATMQPGTKRFKQWLMRSFLRGSSASAMQWNCGCMLLPCCAHVLVLQRCRGGVDHR